MLSKPYPNFGQSIGLLLTVIIILIAIGLPATLIGHAMDLDLSTAPPAFKSNERDLDTTAKQCATLFDVEGEFVTAVASLIPDEPPPTPVAIPPFGLDPDSKS